MKMPILSKREVNTKVIVYDNETIVLGGMVGERMERFNDRVPLLGSIPLLGRLFTSKGERGIKTNLMVFVNVRLVKPDGQPVRANEVRGLYDFKH
jgi:general secretion pathway protein D